MYCNSGVCVINTYVCNVHCCTLFAQIITKPSSGVLCEYCIHVHVLFAVINKYFMYVSFR